MASETVKMVHPNGVTVTVSKDAAEGLERMGFTKPKTATKATTAKSTSK